MNDSDITHIINNFRKAVNRLILLDYDGTLVDYELVPEDAILPEEMAAILVKLTKKQQNTVYIISGRSHHDIDKLLGHIDVNAVSDHGAMIKEDGKWNIIEVHNNSWKKSVKPLMTEVTAECPGSFVEEKEFSIAWHYRNADEQTGNDVSKKLIAVMGEIIHSYDLKILDGNKVVEVLNSKTGKGEASKRLAGKAEYDFILSIGDDVTDEEMFRYFLDIPNAFTVKVGGGKSAAGYNLAGTAEVVSFLKQLSE